MRHPDLRRVHLGERRAQLVPVGVVGDHQRQLDPLGFRSLAHTHPARGEAHHRVGQPARPTIGDGRRGVRARSHRSARPWPPPSLDAGRRAECPCVSYAWHSGISAPCRWIGPSQPASRRSANQPLALAERVAADDVGCARGNSRTLSSSREASPSAGGCRNTGSPKVASVTNTSQGDRLEAAAGRIRHPLVVAGDNRPAAPPLHRHLGAAEHVPGRLQPDPDTVDQQRLAILQHLPLPSRAAPRPCGRPSARWSRDWPARAPWPGRAWSACAWVMIARPTGPGGSMKKPPGSQNSPSGSTLSQVSGCGAIRLQTRHRGSWLPTRRRRATDATGAPAARRARGRRVAAPTSSRSPGPQVPAGRRSPPRRG